MFTLTNQISYNIEDNFSKLLLFNLFDDIIDITKEKGIAYGKLERYI